MIHSHWLCAGFRAVKAETMDDAAHRFAGRLANREFGRLGHSRIKSLSDGQYEATIWCGRSASRYNITLSISRDTRYLAASETAIGRRIAK